MIIYSKSLVVAVAACSTSVALALGPTTKLNIRPAAAPIIGKNGEVRYVVHMDPIYAERFSKEAERAGLVQANILTARAGDASIEKPNVRLLAGRLAARIGKTPLKVISWANTSFEVDALPAEISKLVGVEGVIDIAQLEGKKIEFVLSQAAGDVYAGAEIVPWWRGYTNTNDGNDYTWSPNVPFVVDAPLVSPISSDLNIVYNNSSYDSASWATDPNYWGFWHAAHVNGVIGARSNNQQIRGINPGQQIRHLGSALTYASLIDIFNYISAYTELTYTWSAVNLSINNSADHPPGNNPFEFSQDLGRAMAIASNRNIILQSAGNNNSGGCGWGYSFGWNTPWWDAIMLVGGHDINGQRSVDDNVIFNNGYGTGTVPGSNYGSCVDIWAPSRQITSLRYNTTGTQVLSGTSFAAPIATAIAMRYGDTNTRPLQREWYLRANSQFTGGYTPYYSQIYSVKWAPTGSVLVRHSIVNAWSPQSSVDIQKLYNGTYSDMWNAGAPQGTVVVDLGAVKNVKFVRVTPRSSVALGDSYPIYFSIAPTTELTATATGAYQEYMLPKHGDRAPITLPVNDITTRYLILNGNNQGSWLAYSEIEVYGQ